MRLSMGHAGNGALKVSIDLRLSGDECGTEVVENSRQWECCGGWKAVFPILVYLFDTAASRR
jgi:hypothetical protein